VPNRIKKREKLADCGAIAPASKEVALDCDPDGRVGLTVPSIS
jgi:hypothetical protein